MKNKKLFITIIICIVITLVLGVASIQASITQANATALRTDSVAVKPVSSQIVANGSVTAQNQATLNFQTGGKLVSVPFQEGDKVSQGQTVAQLDTYQLQRQLTAALNNYRSTRDNFDQTQQNSNNQILQDTQRGESNYYGAGIGQYGVDNSATNYLNDVAKRIVDENQANLDNSVINVELANYALQLSTLTSPLTGILTHEDVNVAGQNIGPTTTFVVADPSTMVFRAQVSENDIDFIQIGATATVQINGMPNQTFSGTVSKIYPNKQTLPDGEGIYQVDVSAPGILSSAKLDQTGIVTITSSVSNTVMLVPTWTVLNHQAVWVMESGKPVLKNVTLGKTHGNMIEILSGLSSQDTVIVNPAAIAAKHYQML
ncbi:MAG TPA: efflux RND transporter periplasmic adaptor subunit [Patescibacteria group bacterium]|nr:efflux RND transporter periplasmic adaptor subunit [Patescibacteria group bacterium]